MPDVIANPPAANIQQALERLMQAGARTFILGNIPDLGSTPAYYGTAKGKLASRLIAEYNQGLTNVAAQLRQACNVKIFDFDAMSILSEIAMSPKNFGLKYVTEPYLPTEYINFADPLAPTQLLPENRWEENPEDYTTFWAVAPGSVVHRTLGERAAFAVNAGALE
jgi:outer membrane lipase/esterase